MGEKLYFPLFVDLSEKEVLIVGAGKIAARRVKTILPFAGKIKVIAPEIAPEILAMAAAAKAAGTASDTLRTASAETSTGTLSGHIVIEQRPFAPSDLDGADMVLAITNDKALNTQIGTLCREKQIPVNVSHEKSLCDFYFPGVVQKDDVVIGVTASGRDHSLARSVTEKIREMMEDTE